MTERDVPWTKGPWSVNRQSPRCVARAGDTAKPVGASIDEEYDRTHFAVLIAEARSRHPDDHPHKIPPDEADANARLIAAAPDLAEALAECADSLEAEVEQRYPAAVRGYPSEVRRYERDMEPVVKARAALAKVRSPS